MKNARIYIGVILILIGIFSTIASVYNASSDWIGVGVFVVAAAILFVAYFQTSKIGFLIDITTAFSWAYYRFLPFCVRLPKPL